MSDTITRNLFKQNKMLLVTRITIKIPNNDITSQIAIIFIVLVIGYRTMTAVELSVITALFSVYLEANKQQNPSVLICPLVVFPYASITKTN